MQKTSWIIFFVFVAIATLSTGCNSEKVARDEISVSILPFKFFAEELVGKNVPVNCMLSPGDNPATYQPTPQQIGSLEKSAFYFKNGHLVFEQVWMKNIQGNNKLMHVIDCSHGIHLLEGHHHGETDHHEAEAEEDHHNHDHSSPSNSSDPHYWTLPKNAIIIVNNMYEALKESELISKDTLDARHEKLVRKLSTQVIELDSVLHGNTKKEFIIYHPALSYIAENYQLTQLSIEQEGKTPSVAQLKSLIDRAKISQIKNILIQRQFDTENASLVAKEINAEILVIDPLAYDYFAATKDLALKLEKALNE